MKAIVLKEPGGSENLALENLKKPDLKENEILVRVHAISINPVDVKTRNGGAMYHQLKSEQPLVLGWDISGEVEAIGSKVKKFKKGQLVFGMTNFPGHGKAYAEYVAAPEEHLTLKPEGITHTQAAATSLAALTAWQVLYHEAQVTTKQNILIHAAAGGVGHFAVQMAKLMGRTVSGTASYKNATFLKEIGADRHIDYTKEQIEDIATDIDVILDPIGGDTTLKSIECLRPGGKLISIVGGVKEEVMAKAKDKNIQASNYLVKSSGNDMKKIAELLDSRAIKPIISHVFSFTDIASAHQQIETGKTRGKVVVVV
ncbi:NADP-dependent oxidoreductase [Cytophagaceae bacterium ABcell3]|nr:NADP-dependent oxidoreductase [Cytophagaceae bacterium ABcell3]